MSINTSGRRIGKLLSLLLMFSLLFVPLGPGIKTQAARATGTVKNRILNVRASASTSSSIVCKLTQGTKVTIISETTGDDGLKWYNVYFAYNSDAKEGFVRADLLNVSGSSNSGSSNTAAGSGSTQYIKSGSTWYIKPAVAIVRTKASTKSDIYSKLDRGTSVTVLSSQKGSDDGRIWYKIFFTKNGSSKEGYVRGDLLSETNPGGSSSNTTDVSGVRYVNVDVVRVRTYSSTNGDIRSRLPKGTQVNLISSKTGSDDGKTWYKVSYQDNGYQMNGFIRADMLSETNPGGSSSSGSAAQKSASVKVSVANIRTYASTKGDIRSKLPYGTAVTILSETTGDDGRKWYNISYKQNGSSLEGFIRSDLVSLGGGSSSSGSGSSANTNTPAVAQVRTYASPYADIRATLQNGTKVTILKELVGEDGEKWTNIAFTQNGEKLEGFIPSSMLK